MKNKKNTPKKALEKLEESDNLNTFNTEYNHQGKGEDNDDHEKNMEIENLRLRILNDKNIFIDENVVNKIFERVGFEHKVSMGIKNYQIAMTHESYLIERLTDYKTIKILKDQTEHIDEHTAKNAMPLQETSYEKLEFLGDAVIHCALTEYLFNRYPEMQQGELTVTRSKLEKQKSLSKYSKELGLHKYAVIGYSIEQTNARITVPSLTEDILEAFIGALSLEVGTIEAGIFFIKMIEHLEDIPEIIRTNTNYKEKLMRCFHKIEPNCRHDLRYVVENYENSKGIAKYNTRVYDKMTGTYLGEGKSRNKRKSQQKAAKNALLQIGLIGNSDDDPDENEQFEVTDNIMFELEND